LVNFFKTERGREQLVRICPGSAGRNRVLNLKRLGEVKVPLPPMLTQRRIVERIGELTGMLESAKALRREAADAANALWSSGAARVFNRAQREYERHPLGDLVEIKGGGTPAKANPSYWDGAIPWITPKDMKRRELSDAIDHISEEATRETAARPIEPGAVLVVVRGMILAHTFPSAVLRVPAAINQDMKALRPKKAITSEYLNTLLWAFNSDFLALVEKSTHDTRKLETEKLLAAEIIVPPLHKQQEIVHELDVLRAEIDRLRQLQTQTEAEINAQLPAALERAFHGELWQ
jgi:type I restriction enzyme S subunit